MSNRPLNNTEITALQNQGCFSADWSKIFVTDQSSTDRIHNVWFEGEVKLNKLGGEITTSEGEIKKSGLFNSKINNCEIGDDVLLENVNLVKNYRIMDHVIIENVNSISVNGSSSFVNGFEIEVLNEGGGRELVMFDQLSAQLAYILVCYRHDPELIKAINSLITDYVRNKTSETGSIGAGSEILKSKLKTSPILLNWQGAQILRNEA